MNVMGIMNLRVSLAENLATVTQRSSDLKTLAVARQSGAIAEAGDSLVGSATQTAQTGASLVNDVVANNLPFASLVSASTASTSPVVAAALISSADASSELAEINALDARADAIREMITKLYSAQQNVLSLFGFDPGSRESSVSEPMDAAPLAAEEAAAADSEAVEEEAAAEETEDLDGDNTFALSVGFDASTYQGGETGETLGDLIDASGLGSAATVLYSGSEAGTIGAGADSASFSEIERLVLTDQNDVVSAGLDTVGIDVDTGIGDDTVVGGSGGDTIELGAAGYVDAHAGDDTVTAGHGAGQVEIHGGDGNDTIIYDVTSLSLLAGNQVYGDAGSDTLELRFSGDSPLGVETLVETELAVWELGAISTGTLTGIGLYLTTVETVNLTRADGTVRTFNL